MRNGEATLRELGYLLKVMGGRDAVLAFCNGLDLQANKLLAPLSLMLKMWVENAKSWPKLVPPIGLYCECFSCPLYSSSFLSIHSNRF